MMLRAAINAFKVPDLRRKIIFTLAMLVAFRLVSHIPVPMVNAAAVGEILRNNAILNFLDFFSGGALVNFSVAAMGVYPYITASIVMQLLVPIIPALERISQEPKGQEKINKWTYWLTIPLAALQGYGQMFMLVNQQSSGVRVLNVGEWNLFSLQYFLPSFTILASMIAGTMILIWIGDLITEQGVGNGLSMIIFGGIVARLPSTVGQMMQSGETTVAGWAGVILFLVIALITIVGIVAIQEGKRDLRVRYSSQVRGTKMYGGARTTLPLKVNMAGMIPLIFAQSFMVFPGTVASYLVPPGYTASNPAGGGDPASWTLVQRIAVWVSTTLSTTSAMYWVLLFVLVMFFTFFYTIVVFQQTNMAKNLQKQGAFIEGLRPGERTDKYLNKIVNRITLLGAVFLAVVAVLPFIVQQATGVQVGLSATGLLIVVGVAVDTMKQLEGQLAIRGYEKFIRR